MKAARSRRHHRLQRRTITTTSTTGSAGSERSDTELSTFLPSTEGREQFRPSIAHHASHFSGLLPRSCVIECPAWSHLEMQNLRSPRFVVNHDVDRHQWQVIDRLGSKGQYAAVIAELDDTYATSERVVTRYCRQLNEDHADERKA